MTAAGAANGGVHPFFGQRSPIFADRSALLIKPTGSAGVAPAQLQVDVVDGSATTGTIVVAIDDSSISGIAGV
jgi:hypothetical protein